MKSYRKIQTSYAFSEIKKYLGIESSNTSKTEKVISGIGAMIAILLCQLIALPFMSPDESVLLIASMGATATLIYALPHGALSQPWNVFAGHLTSAFVGILCYQYISTPLLASSIAVGVAVLFMYFLRCLHPPGGATALFCTQGSESVTNLGFNFILDPLLPSTVIIIAVGILFNGLFSWRRYPAHLNFSHIKTKPSFNHLSHEDFSAALLELDSFVDVTTEELAIIFDRALSHAAEHKLEKKLTFQPQKFYSNGSLGKSWNIKQVTHIHKSKVHFKIITGEDQGQIKEASQRYFQQWAKFEVVFSQGNWIKISLI